jgi:uncharacterized damage-inducible protein DinB
MPLNQMLLPEFDQEMASTRKLLERVPDGKMDFKPHEKSMALGRLASHVAEMPGWAKVTLTTELLELEPGQQPFLASTRKEILETFDKNVAEAREALSAASDQDFGKTWTLRMGGKDFLAMPRIAVLRGMVMNHMIHHRAQLGVYLRLNGVEIPGMYGPSADEMNMSAAQAG